MITCDILGPGLANSGLGNQMFCIASTLGLACENNDSATFPQLAMPPFDFYGRTIFHKLPRVSVDTTSTYHEKPYTSTIYNKIPYTENLCIRGHFQSYKYFHEYRENILDMFCLPEYISEDIDKRHSGILENSDSSTSLHVRRGDYLKLAGHYHMLDMSYYQKAVDMQDSEIVVVFSDDIEWCKKEISFDSKKVIFVEEEIDVVDMYLMSKMKNNIIANSTFSWWAAYMNTDKNKKVIGPKDWFGPTRTDSNEVETADLMPEDWTRI